MGSDLTAHEVVRARGIYCFRKIQIVGQKKYRDKTSFARLS